jgi:hypothetical protein
MSKNGSTLATALTNQKRETLNFKLRGFNYIKNETAHCRNNKILTQINSFRNTQPLDVILHLLPSFYVIKCLVQKKNGLEQSGIPSTVIT